MKYRRCIDKVQMKYRWSTYEIQTKYKWSTYEVQMKYRRSTDEVQMKYKWNEVQVKYRRSTNEVHMKYKWSTGEVLMKHTGLSLKIFNCRVGTIGIWPFGSYFPFFPQKISQGSCSDMYKDGLHNLHEHFSNSDTDINILVHVFNLNWRSFKLNIRCFMHYHCFFHHIHLLLFNPVFLFLMFCGEIKLNWIDQLKKKTSL